MDRIKCLIIGGGPAGYTAAIYACRAGLSPVLVEGPEPGGQLTTTSHVENYPGFAGGVEAFTLMTDMRAQAGNLGTSFMSGSVVSCDLGACSVTLDSGSVLSYHTLVIATGASAKYLGVEGEARFRGLGVSACATCDGFFYRKRSVAVVGGGDTAVEEAMYLAGLAREVHVIVRKPFLRASVANRERLEAAPNVTIHYESVTRRIVGDDAGVTGVVIDEKGTETLIPIEGFFLAIGRHPNTEWLSGQLPVDESGYIIADGVCTGVPGVFVAGDVRNTDFRQAITAAADGCRAALEAEKYLKNEIH